MTGLTRKMVPAALALALAASPAVAQSSELIDLFNEGMSLFEQGRESEALATLQRALALDPTSDEAYELFRALEREHIARTEDGAFQDEAWMTLLMRGGQFELVAKRFLDLAELGRIERRNDRDAIRALLMEIKNDPTPSERRRIVATLRARHGEYAVPYMIGALADRSDDDYRVRAMLTLSEMGGSVVPPLMEALEAEATDPYLARNVAVVLGNIGDPRATGSLTWLANSDAEAGVRNAAGEALEDVLGGSSANRPATDILVEEGSAYLNRRDEVLLPYMYSAVVWDWEGGELVPTSVSHDMYGEEMAKKSFFRALDADESNLDARAGLVRAALVQDYELSLVAESGGDVEDQRVQAAEGLLVALTAGPDAMERALSSAMDDQDVAATVAILRAYGQSASAPTTAMQQALGHQVAEVREEAAIALAHTALAGNSTSVDGTVIAELANAGGRSIMRTAMVIDGNQARLDRIVAALSERGVACLRSSTGALGLATLRRAGGVDVVVCANTLPDLTTQAVLTNVRNDVSLSQTPFVVVAEDTDAAEDLYDDRAEAVIGGADDVEAIIEALGERVNVDRAEADDLSRRAALALSALASAGVDVSASAEHLARALDPSESRPDAVIVPAMHVLALRGSAAEGEALLGVLTDDGRSDEARTAAGRALANLLRRTGGVGVDYEAVEVVVNSDAAIAVRQAAAQALGAVSLGDAQRAAAMRASDVTVTE